MTEKVNAKAKLGRDDAVSLVGEVTKVLVAKGRKQLSFDMDGLEEGSDDHEEMIGLMLGRTGNLRAPTMRVGDVLLVGFNAPMYEEFFG